MSKIKDFLGYVAVIVIPLYTVIFIISFLGNTLTWGWFISNKTEQKYLRHISSYSNYEGGGISMMPNEVDTLSYFHVTMDEGIGFPLAKWAIDNVGLVPRWSKLSHKLDSINNIYSRRYK